VPSKQISLVEALQRLAKGRDEDAWHALLEHCAVEIHALCSRMTGDATLADDVLQEVLLQLRDHAKKFVPVGADPENSAHNWIKRVACFTCMRLQRDRHRAQRRDLRIGESTVNNSVEQKTPESIATGKETKEILQRELAKLPEQYRVSLLLHYYGGLNNREIAAELACPVGTVKTNMHRGLEKLRQRLAVLGITLPAIEITQQIGAPMAGSILPAAGQVLQMQALLHGSQTAACSGIAAATGGLSIMAKGAISAAIMTVVATTAITVHQNSNARDCEPEPVTPTIPDRKPSTDPETPKKFRREGVVLSIRPNVVVISTGEQVGVALKDKVTIHRGAEYVAQAEVSKIFPDRAETTVIEGTEKSKPQISDGVIVSRPSDLKEAIGEPQAPVDVAADAVLPKYSDGLVLAVRNEVNLLMLSLGAQQGVKPGQLFLIHRQDKLVAQAQVEKVYPDMCSARLLKHYDQGDVQIHDSISTTASVRIPLLEKELKDLSARIHTTTDKLVKDDLSLQKERMLKELEELKKSDGKMQAWRKRRSAPKEPKPGDF
jgi:RNA polymerase sigma-70 factor, ECF subfamily